MIKDQINLLTEQVKAHKARLKAILVQHGYNPTADTFESLLTELTSVYILHPNQRHQLFKLDKHGFIVDAVRFHTSQIVQNAKNVPGDIMRGYYKLVDGKIVLDEKRKEEILSLD
jgi:hypothetical protein